jgi:hypothetical protein
MPKIRLDVLLMERGLAESRAKAHALVMAGQVRVNDQVALKPATAIDPKATLTVDSGPRYVSRGGEKLEGALTTFALLHRRLYRLSAAAWGRKGVCDRCGQGHSALETKKLFAGCRDGGDQCPPCGVIA